MRILITGITGQDGSLLAKSLLDKGHCVYGIYRRLSTPNFWRLQHLGIMEKVKLIPGDLLDSTSLIDAVQLAQPDAIYNLAAQSFVGASFEQPIGAGEITGIGVARMLEAIRQTYPRIRFYQASTSELYGLSGVDGVILNEDTPFKPSSPYAVAKLYGYWTTRVYREGYDIFASNGILFNHESDVRGLEFVTRKVTNAVAKISLGLADKIELGNLDAKRDWGHAKEYIESMQMMMAHNEPGDYVIATGETHSVREMCEVAFSRVGLDWNKYVVTNDKYTRPIDVKCLRGDYSKAKTDFGWEPLVKFKQLIEGMVDSDLSRWKRWQNGETFPWDAYSYPEESQIISKMQNRGG